jgi:hypothetical protein
MQVRINSGIASSIEKSKGMRWATFDREMKRLKRVESVVNAHTWVFVERLTKSS